MKQLGAFQSEFRKKRNIKKEDKINKIYIEDCREGLAKLPDECIQCCVTSPPYWGLRDYGVNGQIGLEKTPEQYTDSLVQIFAEVKRVLKSDGVLWLNLGDAYWGSGKAGSSSGYKARHKEFGKKSVRDTSCFGMPTNYKHESLKPKDLIGLPWMVAFAMRKAGWYLRQDIIWHKPNPTPESVTDRCTKSHEHIFLFAKNPKYYFDNEAIKTPAKGKSVHDILSMPVRKGIDNPYINAFRGKTRGPYLTANRRSVWPINTKPFKGAHFAVFPTEIPKLCILAGSREDDMVLDPFMGAGTTAVAAKQLGRNYIGFELNPEYVSLAEKRLIMV